MKRMITILTAFFLFSACSSPTSSSTPAENGNPDTGSDTEIGKGEPDGGSEPDNGNGNDEADAGDTPIVDDRIEIIKIYLYNFTPPVATKIPFTANDLSTGADNHYSIHSVAWNPNDPEFVYGTPYKVEIILDADQGYKFASNDRIVPSDYLGELAKQIQNYGGSYAHDVRSNYSQLGIIVSFPKTTDKAVCFPAGALVTMRSGEQKPIETIVAGDEVATFNGWATVKIAAQLGTAGLYEVRHETGSIVVTEEHPFAVNGKYKSINPQSYTEFSAMIGAKQLQVGDVLTVQNGSTKGSSRVLAITKLARHETVYNLILDNDFTFIVDGVSVVTLNTLAAYEIGLFSADLYSTHLPGFARLYRLLSAAPQQDQLRYKKIIASLIDKYDYASYSRGCALYQLIEEGSSLFEQLVNDIDTLDYKQCKARYDSLMNALEQGLLRL